MRRWLCCPSAPPGGLLPLLPRAQPAPAAAAKRGLCARAAAAVPPCQLSGEEVLENSRSRRTARRAAKLALAAAGGTAPTVIREGLAGGEFAERSAAQVSEIVGLPAGAAVVVAGPGTGKTRIIAARIAKLLVPHTTWTILPKHGPDHLGL